MEPKSLAFIQKKAPQFKGTALVAEKFKEIKLDDYSGSYLVLLFYPLNFTFVCPTEIIAFSDRIDEFKSLKCEVVACSVDSEYSHLAWTKTPRSQGGLGPMSIPLLSDIGKQIASDYGVLLDGKVALRGLFIIDAKGILRQITINDLPVGRSVDEVLRLVKAFQFADKYGEVCPADWNPGDKAIKPDPINSQKYFAEKNKQKEKEKEKDKNKNKEKEKEK